ncbi:acyl-CoA dehydrogenase family protein [Extensimonas sp. H3M7-6]|uniref:acyl-CoA dehydrogenase family protein n=1 Tax=Extensimonas soli TaxID=3031322 RepID=UPI0023DBC4FE|nr:acyl-CoA dehydrogenase family protein [Extensimonas sp. H3M7-6]MDF1482338.1 acyl-CoA dehydrogenase family protein [Extensimonas sp. H3M7-6]
MVPETPSAPATAAAAGATKQDLHRALREALQTAPPTGSSDGAGGFPRAWWAHLGRCGMLGLGFSLDGRPSAADAVQVSALAGQITHATGSLGLGMAWMMQQMLGRYVLGPLVQQGAAGALDASHALLTKLLASMAAGECLLALAISEPGVGAQPKHLRTRAVQPSGAAGDGDWVLDGHKAFVSNGPAADAIIVLAVSAVHEGRKRFDAFLLDAQTPGLTREANARVQGLAPPGACRTLGVESEKAPQRAQFLPDSPPHSGAMGQEDGKKWAAAAHSQPTIPKSDRLLGHCDLRLESCRVPASRRIGPPGRAFETIARPVRAVEDALLLGPLLGAMQCELEALAHALGTSAVAAGTADTAASDAVRELGALQLEWQALHAVRDAVARQLEVHGCDDALAFATVGARRLLERWQTAYENAWEAASQALAIAALPSLTRDLRLVLGIARGVAHSRQLQTGQQLLQSLHP